MYVRKIHIDGIKLLRNFELDFTRDGEPRMWTVLVGPNGLCKTSILRALALAASGRDRANQLAQDLLSSLRDARRPESAVTVRGQFGFGEVGERCGRKYPGLEPPIPNQLVDTHLILEPERRLFNGGSSYDQRYDQRGAVQSGLRIGQSLLNGADVLSPLNDPLEEARDLGLPHWFMAGYGVRRSLPLPRSTTRPEDLVRTRVEPLFDRGELIGTGFADHFDGEQALTFARILKHVLLTHEDMLPNIENFDLRGKGGANTADGLIHSHRFDVRAGPGVVKLPATWLSHGYQAALAWLADVIGHILWEASAAGLSVDIEPEQMEGLVLVDELDLHLHPRWQVGLIPALKRTFPRLQFVVTTHSPMLLAGLEADEIIMCEQDPASGDIVPRQAERAAKLMTGTQMLEQYFGIDQLYPINLAKQLRRYGNLANDPYRSDEEQAELEQLRTVLEGAGLHFDWQPLERKSA
ncbi:ATP binding protein [Enhygromyxa salina]|uniref:ATP binding protein n=1 Tax=Enhygromyxa salina TaxID=215803 RepID=A0A0C1ZD75_9BACT|nr:AAA family ATPase [Enhygromyxa salina]KIG15629.1 ATP binding protein [Enhygromyxa salina]